MDLKLELEALQKENWELHRKLSRIEVVCKPLVTKGKLGFPVREGSFDLAERIYQLARG